MTHLFAWDHFSWDFRASSFIVGNVMWLQSFWEKEKQRAGRVELCGAAGLIRQSETWILEKALTITWRWDYLRKYLVPLSPPHPRYHGLSHILARCHLARLPLLRAARSHSLRVLNPSDRNNISAKCSSSVKPISKWLSARREPARHRLSAFSPAD